MCIVLSKGWKILGLGLSTKEWFLLCRLWGHLCHPRIVHAVVAGALHLEGNEEMQKASRHPIIQGWKHQPEVCRELGIRSSPGVSQVKSQGAAAFKGKSPRSVHATVGERTPTPPLRQGDRWDGSATRRWLSA